MHLQLYIKHEHVMTLRHKYDYFEYFSISLSDVQYYPEQTGDGSLSHFEIIVTNRDITGATVMELLPFTQYDCYVTANTSVGEGPPSSTLTQRTVESGECGR